MNTKNLWLRFALVGILVLLCIWPLVAGEGLRWGIDLRGGHSLVFEIRTNEAERDRIKQRKEQLEVDLQAAANDEKKAAIQAQLERVEIDLSRYAEDEPGDLVQQMIALLKRRVDPNGLRSLEWRPVGKNRIEIRMPAGKGDAREKRDAYFSAMDRLEDNNIQRSEIRDVLQSGDQDRAAKIERYTRGDEDQIKRFEGLVAADGKVAAARQARDAAASQRIAALKVTGRPANLAELDQAVADAQKAMDNAQVAYEEAQDDLLEKGNIGRQELHLTLENYYNWQLRKKGLTGQSAVRKSREFGQDLVVEEIDTRDTYFETSLDKLRERHPARAGEIDEVLALFQVWTKGRERLDDPADLIRLIAKAGVLEFRIAPLMPTVPQESAIKLTADQYEQYVQSLRTEGPEGLRNRNARYQWFPVHGQDEPGTQKYILLYNQPGYQMLHESRGAWRLTSSKPDQDQMGRPAIAFGLNEAGASRMAKLTAAHQTHPMAILLDDEVYSAPFIQEGAIISDSGIITGSFTSDEVADLVSTLKAGSLPAKLNPNPVSTNSFGPGIGQESRDRGYLAARWGLIVVAGFMLAYYLLSGAIANVALLLNVILILGTMSWFGAVFTLPGIAGMILTIGIAVDANVLIFERLREEQAKGQSVRMAVNNAYQRAFSAIMDANVTTLLTCLILGWVGTEEVRGFAITLGLGVMFSLFTSLVVTRWIFQLLLDLKIIRKPITMLRIIGVPKINWMAKRRLFWGLSIIFVAMGIASLVQQGGDIWGIEFSSGTQATMTFRDDALLADGDKLVLPNDALVRDKFKAAAKKLGYDKLEATARVETRLNPSRVDTFIKDYDDRSQPDGKVSLAEWKAAKMDEGFFGRMDTNGDKLLTAEELDEQLASVSYQVSTTETDVEKILQAAREAFGTDLRTRSKLDFEPVAGQDVAELGIMIPADGRLQITPSVQRKIPTAYRQEFSAAESGVLFVVRQVNPTISRSELVQRIRDMRAQPDYASQIFSKASVIGLTPAGEGKFSAFAVIVSPADPGTVARPDAWDQFADGEWSLLSESLKRSTAMPVSNFDAAIAGQTAQLAVVAVILSWLSIVIYLWFRFGSVQWGLAAVICLIHDVVIVVGLVAASNWICNTWIGQSLGIQPFKIDLAMVAAFLTVIGYSVNDTIVIFDRIRENRGKLKTVSEQVINASINQTLSRTLLTTGTTFIVVMIMYVMGGTGLHAFNYALLAGILFGTYSSVAIASPLLMGFKKAVAGRVTASAGRD